jgi:nucleoside-diphosphate-sugar epimerase
MRALLTGSEGYIGTVLGPRLAAAGHLVTGLDTCFFADAFLYQPSSTLPASRRKDTREATADDLSGYDAVVHLAELSNDPLGELDPGLTEAINYRATVRLAGLARQAGVSRFLYFSSCSVYGAGGDAPCTEASPVHPQTEYARAKYKSETAIGNLASSSFCPVVLRNATVFGPSPRMRLDLVLNNLAGHAWTSGEIRMTSDGSPWRPLIHIADLCEAAALVLEAPREEVCSQVFNCGDSRANYRVAEIASAVATAFPGCLVTTGRQSADQRSYRVSFEKIRSLLGFTCRRFTQEGARELHGLFEATGLTRAQFEGPAFTRLKKILELRQRGTLDAELRWQWRAARAAAHG